LDCSPINRERELGLDRRETGWFYPTISFPRDHGKEAVVVREELTVNANGEWLVREGSGHKLRMPCVPLKAS